VFSCEYKDLYSQVKAIQVHCIIQHIVFVISLSLPLGVHFFCVAKRNRTKDKYAGAYLKRGATPTGVKYMDVFHTKATLIACIPKLSHLLGVDENSLGSDTRPLTPSNRLFFGGDKMG
jgi:hypothetical protein